jgi:DNA-binding transcriptional LysR family regulator
MDLNQLMVFAKVAEYHSFTKAAQELGMEKSTVSSKISQLEKRLGARLLNRTTRLVTLTEAGEGYYHYCRQIVESAREADHYAETFTREPQGVLRISVSQDFGQLLVQQLIKPFMQAYPGLKIDLCIFDREVDLIAERYDIALRIGPGTLKDSNLVGKKLFDIEMGLFASPEFLSEYGEPRTVTELAKYPFVFFNKEQEPVFKFSAFIVPQFLENSNGNLKINDILSCKEAALVGLGVSILPADIVQKEVASNKLKRILGECDLSPMALFAVYPSRHWIPSKLKVFLEYLEKWKR